MLNLYRLHTNPSELDQQGAVKLRAAFNKCAREFEMILTNDIDETFNVSVSREPSSQQYKLSWKAEGSDKTGVIIVEIVPKHFEILITVDDKVTVYDDVWDALRSLHNDLGEAKYEYDEWYDNNPAHDDEWWDEDE